METEKTIYTAYPSHLLNLPYFLIGLVISAAIVTAYVLSDQTLILLMLILPIGYVLAKDLALRASRFTLTDQRIIVSQGVLNKTTNETELYRVRDITIMEPFYLRLFGLGNIIVYTTDEARATHTFKGFANPHWVKDQIRNHAEICRQKKRWGNDNVLLHDHFNQ